MNSRAALGAAAGVALTVAGGVSALFLTVAQATPQDPTTDQTAVTVEYVDQNGNPVADPNTTDPNTTVPVTPDIVVLNPDGTPVTATEPSTDPANGYGEAEVQGEHEEGEHEANEHEADEDEGEEDEHEEDEDEYGDAEHAAYDEHAGASAEVGAEHG